MIRRNGALVLGVALLWVGACSGTSSGGGTQTNWVKCRADADCPGKQVCANRICQEPGDGGAGEGSGSRDATTSTPWLPPPGAYDCDSMQPLELPPGEGLCSPPSEQASPYCVNACWDVPGAPGPEGCPPTIVEEFGGTRCCFPGGCGVALGDGEGCQSFVELPEPDDDPMPVASPCSVSSATPERLYQGFMDRIVMTTDSVVAGRFNGFTGGVVRISKETCAATEVPIESVWDVAATDEATYVIGSDEATAPSAVLAISPSGAITEVPIAGLFGAHAVGFQNLASTKTSLYVLVSVQREADGAPEKVLVELPCCGAAPRVLTDDLTAWELIGDSVRLRLASDGQTIVAAGYVAILDESRREIAGVFDIATRAATLLFDFFHGNVEPFAVDGGRLHMAAGTSVVGLEVTDCTVTRLADRPRANVITALAVDGDDVFWAEGYSNFRGARLFAKVEGGPETQLAAVSGAITWIGVDERDVYFVLQNDGDPPALIRRRRP